MPNHVIQRMLLVAVAVATVFASLARAGDSVYAPEFDHQHTMFAQVLQAVVDVHGNVDYAALKEDHRDLHLYLKAMASVDSGLYRSWTAPRQLAYLINLYNAQTLDLVIRHYPLHSIRDIGNLWRGPWGQPVVSLMGKITTLDYLEHKIIRPNFPDPAIHFALVCAARSAPALRTEPYVEDRLSEQLTEQAQRFIADLSKNKVDIDAGILHLSSVFKWFASDFEQQAGSVEAYIKPYLEEDQQAAMENRSFVIRHLDFDWSLNKQ